MNLLKPHSGFGCCPFQGGGSVVVYSLFIVAPIVFVGFVLGSLFCYDCLVLQSFHWGRESWLLYYYCLDAMWLLLFFALPHIDVGWSAVCGCGISWSYLLF